MWSMTIELNEAQIKALSQAKKAKKLIIQEIKEQAV